MLSNHQATLSKVGPKVDALEKTVETQKQDLADHSLRIKTLEEKMAHAVDVEKETRATLSDQAEALDRLKQLLRKMGGQGGLSADIEERLVLVEVNMCCWLAGHYLFDFFGVFSASPGRRTAA